MKNEIIEATIKSLAAEAAYTPAEINAALDFVSRKNRWTRPEGTFDEAGRFHAAERTDVVKRAGSPTIAYPGQEMIAASSVAHCAEVHDADEVHNVLRVARAYELLIAEAPIYEVKKLLKPFTNARLAAAEARELEEG